MCMNIREFFLAVILQDKNALRSYFHADAIIRWHCSNEMFTVDEYIRANCEYPGNWDGEIERAERFGDQLILAARIFPTDNSASYHVVSVIRLQDDRIIQMDEYWADDAPPPDWRKQMKIGRKII